MSCHDLTTILFLMKRASKKKGRMGIITNRTKQNCAWPSLGSSCCLDADWHSLVYPFFLLLEASDSGIAGTTRMAAAAVACTRTCILTRGGRKSCGARACVEFISEEKCLLSSFFLLLLSSFFLTFGLRADGRMDEGSW